MGCRCAPSLKKALEDATKQWPKRWRLSDGCCADDRHIKAGKSDHIADESGYAHAADLTHNPENGLDCNVLIAPLLLDRRVKYLIFNKKIYYPGSTPRAYTGANAHKQHIHISIKPNAHLDMSDWPWSPKQPTIAMEDADDEAEVLPHIIAQAVDTTQEDRETGRQGDRETVVYQSPDSLNEAPKDATSATVIVKDGDVSVKTSTEGAKVLSLVAVEKPASAGFLPIIKSRITTLAGGNVTLQVVRDYAEQARLFGLSARFWFWISVIASLATAVYLISLFYKHRSDVKRDLEITNTLIASNSTPDTRIELVATEDIDKFKDRGFKIVRR